MSAFPEPPPQQRQSDTSEGSTEAIPPPPPPPLVQPLSQPPPESYLSKVDSTAAPSPVVHEHRPPTPPPSLPSFEQPQPRVESFAPPPPSEIPPPPAVPLPSHIVQPPQLEHVDSASSVVAEPPTPLASSTPAPQPQVNGNATTSSNGQSEHAGLGMGMHGEGHPGQSAVDVLADVAMGEAAMDLAGFAAGAGVGAGAGDGVGSADVKEEATIPPPPQQIAEPPRPATGAEPSPPLKRSFEESNPVESQENGYFGASVNGGHAEGDAETRETKRPRVEEQILSHESTASRTAAPVGSQPPQNAAPPPLPSVSVQASAPTQSPTPTPQPEQYQQQVPPAPQPQPTPSPAPTPSQSYDPSLAPPPSTNLAPAAPSPALPSVSTAPTMSPSDLHHFPQVAKREMSATPIPSHQPSPAPVQSQPSYDSSNAFAQQSSPYPPAASASPYPPPVASTSTGVVPSPVPSTSHQASPLPPTQGGADQQPPPANPSEPPPAEPIAVMTKEQQKHAINLVRNLKRNKNASPFLKPVDHIALHIPDYYKIITNPSDLGSVEARLQATGKAMTNVHKVGRIYGLDYSHGQQPGVWEGQVPEGFEPKGYRTVAEFKEDLDRIWNNCFRYNGPRDKNPVSAMAGAMMDAAEKNYRGMPFAPAVSPYPPRHVSPEVKREPRPAPGFVPTIRRDDASSRPKREIHAPVKDLAYLDSADPQLAQYQQPAHQPMMMQQHHQAPPQKARSNKRGPQEQLRFCKETIKELFKKSHEPYAYPFYQPVDLAAYPTYSQYVSRPMDLSTIRSKLEHNQYPLPPYDAFESDVRQIFENCFAFNPAGTIVHNWGRQLEAVFEFKWADRPLDDADDASEDDGLNVMEQQLQMLAANIEQMRQNKKAQKEARRYSQQPRPMMPPVPMPMPSKPPKKAAAPMQQGGYNPYMPPRAQAPKKLRPSGGGGGGGGNRKKKRRDDDSDDYFEDDGGAYYGGSGHVGAGGGGGGGGGGGQGGGNRRHVPVQQEEYVDFEMKRELAVKIVTFEGENLEEAINIIRRGRPDLLGAANQEVELDIDQLDQRTLVALYRYVCPGAPVPVRPIENAKPSKQQTSNKQPRNQRKNLDEEKEAERIELMEQQLRAFEKSPAEVAAGGALPPTPQAQPVGEDGGGGDQASSDSSDEASSDSDSDED